MAQTRLQIARRALLGRSALSKIKRIYFRKNTTYGTYCDSIEYNTVRLTYETTRTNYQKTQKGTKSDRSLWRAREKIYQLIEANIRADRKPIFFTLTSGDQQKDLKESNKKIKALMRRLKIFLGYSPEYIIVPEKHKSHAIHYHGVFFNLPYIHVKKFRYEIWKYGYVDLQLPKKIRSVARYLAKYLTKNTLEHLPKNEKTYFTSRGLKRPVTDFTTELPSGTLKTLEISRLTNGVKTKYLCQQEHQPL